MSDDVSGESQAREGGADADTLELYFMVIGHPERRVLHMRQDDTFERAKVELFADNVVHGDRLTFIFLGRRVPETATVASINGIAAKAVIHVHILQTAPDVPPPPPPYAAVAAAVDQEEQAAQARELPASHAAYPDRHQHYLPREAPSAESLRRRGADAGAAAGADNNASAGPGAAAGADASASVAAAAPVRAGPGRVVSHTLRDADRPRAGPGAGAAASRAAGSLHRLARRPQHLFTLAAPFFISLFWGFYISAPHFVSPAAVGFMTFATLVSVISGTCARGCAVMRGEASLDDDEDEAADGDRDGGGGGGGPGMPRPRYPGPMPLGRPRRPMNGLGGFPADAWHMFAT